jgi:molecular chaperone GrpE (heat shock protein)
MSLATPSDYDGEQSDPTNDDAPAEHESTEERTDPDEPDPVEDEAGELSIEELQQAVEDNSSALEAKADGDLVRSLLSRLNELQNRLIRLEDNHGVMHDYLLKLEKQRRDWLDTIDQNDEAVAQLSAAVFGDNPECPECGDGHLTSGEPWLGKRVVCSNGDCEFERSVSGF